MKVIVEIRTDPQSFDLEDAIGNELQGRGLGDDLEFEISQLIEEWMGWEDIGVLVTVKEA